MPLSYSLLLFAAYWTVMTASYLSPRWFAVLSVGASLFFGFWSLSIFDLVAVAPMIVLAVLTQSCRRHRMPFEKYFVRSSAVLAVAVVWSIPRTIEVWNLLRKHHIESLSARLRPRTESAIERSKEYAAWPLNNSEQARVSKPPASALFLEALDHSLQIQSTSIAHRRQHSQAKLAALHESTLKIFVDAPGFGTSRIGNIPIRKQLIGLPEIEPIRLSARTDVNRLPRGEESFSIHWAGRLPLEELWHVKGSANFLNPRGFGYVRQQPYGSPNLDHTIGFQAHGFQAMPDFTDKSRQVQWQVDRLDLVSLLLNDPPVVYVSENLPNMAELAVAPTRALLEFENDGLDRLRAGETLVVASSSNSLRMLGAVRVTRSCQDCHNAQQGTLVGAFSYLLRRTSPLSVSDDRGERTNP